MFFGSSSGGCWALVVGVRRSHVLAMFSLLFPKQALAWRGLSHAKGMASGFSSERFPHDGLDGSLVSQYRSPSPWVNIYIYTITGFSSTIRRLIRPFSSVPSFAARKTLACTAILGVFVSTSNYHDLSASWLWHVDLSLLTQRAQSFTARGHVPGRFIRALASRRWASQHDPCTYMLLCNFSTMPHLILMIWRLLCASDTISPVSIGVSCGRRCFSLVFAKFCGHMAE